jgi:hypothetical protein
MTARKFLVQCTLLALPIAMLFALVAWVDPYSLYGTGGPIPRELKEKNLYHSGRTMPFSNTMWKLIDFRRTPSPNILLGDSRLSRFDVDSLQHFTGDSYFNFGIPGGNFVTIDRLFHYADSVTELKHVVVQVAFRGMEMHQNFDSYEEPRMILEKPWSYVHNRRVMEAAGLNLVSNYFPSLLSYDVPGAGNWEMVLAAEKESTEHFVIDTTVYGRLQKIADRCRAEGADLIFVEYPTHPDLQHIMSAAGLGSEREAYLERLRTTARVIDLDQPGLFPSDRSFWRDPLHLTVDAQRMLIPHIWGSH